MSLLPKEIETAISGCKVDDRKSQKLIYEKYYSRLMTICLRYSHDADDAKDVLQEGFLKIFASIKVYTDTGSFEGWMKRIIVNTAIDYYRKKKRENFISTNSDYLFDMAEDGSMKEEEEEEGFLYQIDPKVVMAEIQELSPAYRMVFNMYVMEGYTHKQIAETLGINEGTSKSNLAKAKMNLKKKLTKYVSK